MTTATRPLCRTDPAHGPSLVRELCSPCYQAQRGEVAGLAAMWRRMFS